MWDEPEEPAVHVQQQNHCIHSRVGTDLKEFQSRVYIKGLKKIVISE